MVGAMDLHEHGLGVAADLLSADDSNPYHLDAAGYLRTTSQIIAQSDSPKYAASQAYAAMRQVGDYAAGSEQYDLADHAFDFLDNPAERWRLYGIAAVSGTIDQHPNWSLWATSEVTQEATNRHQRAVATMHVAKASIAMNSYVGTWDAASKLMALDTARTHKRSAFTAVEHHNVKQYETGMTRGEVEEIHLALDSLFAELGLWRDVDSPDPVYPLSNIASGNQLAVKAAVGELTKSERRKLGRNPALRDLLLFDAMARGEVFREDAAGINNPLAGNVLLAAAAPKAFVHLGLAEPDQLDVYFKAGKALEAAREYLHMQRYGKAPKLLTASLQMAPHNAELQTLQGAYSVYRGDVDRKIGRVQDYTSEQDWRALPVSEADAMHPIIYEQGPELYSLDERVDRLLACARQFSVALEVDPSSEATGYALYLLRDTWDELEQMESYNNKLPALAAILKEHGITIVWEWKHHSTSDFGYVGYGLATPAIPHEKKGDGTFYVREYKLEWWRDAARKLNELHGEDRFVVIEYPETRPSANSDETEHRIAVEGGWQEQGLGMHELVSAEGTASWTDGSLNTLPHITDRLMALHLADS